jgi:hypothetical protein
LWSKKERIVELETPWFVQSKVNGGKLFWADCRLVSKTAYSWLLIIARTPTLLEVPEGKELAESKINKASTAEAVTGVAQPANLAARDR